MSEPTSSSCRDNIPFYLLFSHFSKKNVLIKNFRKKQRVVANATPASLCSSVAAAGLRRATPTRTACPKATAPRRHSATRKARHAPRVATPRPAQPRAPLPFPNVEGACCPAPRRSRSVPGGAPVAAWQGSARFRLSGAGLAGSLRVAAVQPVGLPRCPTHPCGCQDNHHIPMRVHDRNSGTVESVTKFTETSTFYKPWIKEVQSLVLPDQQHDHGNICTLLSPNRILTEPLHKRETKKSYWRPFQIHIRSIIVRHRTKLYVHLDCLLDHSAIWQGKMHALDRY
jgi:hypothetical protein